MAMQKHSSSQRNCKSWGRRLRLEPLESRCMLAVITVSNAHDEVNGNVSSIEELIANDGGDGISLREAILAANTTNQPDIIRFDPIVFSSSNPIFLNGAPLEIRAILTIDGSALDSRIVIDAQLNSQIIRSANLSSSVHLVGLELRHGQGDHGGAIRFSSFGTLSLIDCVVTGNRSGEGTSGGAIHAGLGKVIIERSVIADNHATGSGAEGGAIYVSSGTLEIRSSTVSGNSTNGSYGGAVSSRTSSILIADSVFIGNATVAGNQSYGGAVYTSNGTLRIIDSLFVANHSRTHGGAVAGYVLDITRSRFLDNYTTGVGACGGAVYGAGIIDASEFNGNFTTGFSAVGGAICGMSHLDLDIVRSTISGNRTLGQEAHGGGVGAKNFARIHVRESTITDNHAEGAASVGGGIGAERLNLVKIEGSIIAGNSNQGPTAPDIGSTETWVPEVAFSLVGNSAGANISASPDSSNRLDVDPLLAPLEYHGGNTRIHMTLPGSPARDAGDPSRLFDPYEYDQRDAPYSRVGIGRIDIGAYEFVTEAPGDFNRDGNIDIADYITWRNQLGESDLIPQAGADANGDGMITVADYLVWKRHFQLEFVMPGSSIATVTTGGAEGSALAVVVTSSKAQSADGGSEVSLSQDSQPSSSRPTFAPLVFALSSKRGATESPLERGMQNTHYRRSTLKAIDEAFDTTWNAIEEQVGETW